MLPIVFWPPSCHELHGVKLFTYDVVSKEFYIVKDSFSVLPNIFFFLETERMFLVTLQWRSLHSF